MTDAQVLEVLAACAAQGLPVWVDGGWAVDAGDTVCLPSLADSLEVADFV